MTSGKPSQYNIDHVKHIGCLQFFPVAAIVGGFLPANTPADIVFHSTMADARKNNYTAQFDAKMDKNMNDDQKAKLLEVATTKFLKKIKKQWELLYTEAGFCEGTRANKKPDIFRKEIPLVRVKRLVGDKKGGWVVEARWHGENEHWKPFEEVFDEAFEAFMKLKETETNLH